jgi:D-tyrosyl-tRNA(Tyr) deacylase
MMENKGIDVPKLQVPMLTVHIAGNLVKVDLVGGDVDIYRTQPGKLSFEY